MIRLARQTSRGTLLGLLPLFAQPAFDGAKALQHLAAPGKRPAASERSASRLSSSPAA